MGIADAIGEAKGRTSKRRGVSRTSDLRRIIALPRRQWTTEQAQDAASLLSGHLRRPTIDTDTAAALWPIQAIAMIEIADHRGGFLPVGVGRGKTLITLLIAALVGALRPLLLVPSALRAQTLKKAIPEALKSWAFTPPRVVGHSELSVKSGAHKLDNLAPDLIIIDEAHAFANVRSARTRRVARYIDANDPIVVLLSGTMATRSISDYAHLIRWALGRGAPLPLSWFELQDWSAAIDEKVPEQDRLAPGALSVFCEPGENVRQGYRRRLVETPGVVASSEGELGISLRVTTTTVTPPDEVARVVTKAVKFWETPDGEPIMRAVELWAMTRQLALGFRYRLDPPAPVDWLAARTAWGAYVRDRIRADRSGAADSMLQVWNECKRAEKPPAAFTDWRDIRGTFKPNKVTDWIDPFVVNRCAAWLDNNPRGIVWVEHIALGEEVARVAGVPYFGAGAKAASDVLDHVGPMVCSLAHATGKNLQFHHDTNLIPSPMPTGKVWEQLLGRTHREGQEADEVTAEVLHAVDAHRDAFDQAIRDAHYLEETLGERQRLLYCDLVRR